MRTSSILGLSFVLLAAGSLAAACSSSESASPGGTGGSGGTGGTGGSGGTGGADVDSGTDAGNAAGEGCGYALDLDATRYTGVEKNSVALGSAATPTRVRIGYGGSTTAGDAAYADPARTAAIVWDTDVDTLATTVRFGTSETALDQVRTGVSYLLPGTVPTRVHQVHLCGLAPNTTYYYQAGGGPESGGAFSPVLSFTTLPAAGDAAAFDVGVSGDSRDSLDVIWPAVQHRMAALAPRFQAFTGDSIQLALPGSEADYAKWLDAAWKTDATSAGGDLVLGRHPLLPIGGNHENLQQQWLANFAWPGGGKYQGYYFSFDAGAAHFVWIDDNVLASKVDMVGQKALLDFLEADLTAADAHRDTTPWVVVMHHRGELSTSNHGGDSDVLAMRALTMPIWDAHKVSLVLNGHDHNYERSKPATFTGGAPTVAADAKSGTTYVVCAGAGAGGYTPGDGSEAYSDVRVGFGGSTPYVGVYGALTVSGTELAWKAYGLKAGGSKPADDDVIDSFSIAK